MNCQWTPVGNSRFSTRRPTGRKVRKGRLRRADFLRDGSESDCFSESGVGMMKTECRAVNGDRLRVDFSLVGTEEKDDYKGLE